MKRCRILPLLLVSLRAFAVEWQQAGWGGGGYYWAAAYHPTHEGVIYMAGDCCGVYKTDDHGKQWRIINRGLASYAVYSLAVDPTQPDCVYASTEQGLCKSTDAGASWVLLPKTGPKELRITGERERSFRALAIDPRNGQTLYAASPAGKIYKSADGGQTWIVAYSKEAESPTDGTLRLQFGKINGEYYGDVALPVAFPTNQLSPRNCHAIGFTLSGDGAIPKDCYLMLRTQSGATYRSPNLREIFEQKALHDVLLKSSDFNPDPHSANAYPTRSLPAFTDADWSTIVRLDLACSGALPDHATIGKFKQFFFEGSVSGKPARGVIRDFANNRDVQKFGNLHIGAPLSGTIYSVTIAPSDPSHILAATHDDGLLLSTDAGQSWHPLATPKHAACGVFDPTNPSVIYGAFFAQGLMKSGDAGKTWKVLPTGSPDIEMIDLAINAKKPNTVYAIGSKNWNGAFFYSDNGGETWARTSKIEADTRSNPTRDGVYNGIANLSSPRMIALSPTTPDALFLAANWRACLSMDGGRTWSERDRGCDISCITDIRFHKGKTYVTAMDEGTFVSENHGASWQQLWPLHHTPGLSGHNWRVAITDVGGQERILSTVTPWYKTPTCVVRSDDAGKTFSVILSGLPDYTIYPNTMWGQGHPRALAVDPNAPNIVYLGIDGDPSEGKRGGGLFRSTDGGETWNQLPNQPGSRRMFYGLAVDPTNSQRLYWGACGNKGGVWRSEDQGKTWSHIFKNECFIWNVLVTPQGTLYCSGQQLWRSTDHGATWHALTAFSGERSVVACEVHPREPSTLWVATTTWDSRAVGGVFKSTDNGKTWNDITGNLPCIKPQILRYNPDTAELWAGHVGLYKCQQ